MALKLINTMVDDVSYPLHKWSSIKGRVSWGDFVILHEIIRELHSNYF